MGGRNMITLRTVRAGKLGSDKEQKEGKKDMIYLNEVCGEE
jgi:hypothetical protein